MTMYDITATAYDKRGRIIAIGKNSYQKTHPLQSKYAIKSGLPEKIYLHAEIAAIIKSKEPSKIFQIHVERYIDGNPALAKPCPVCQTALDDMGISNVTYTR